MSQLPLLPDPAPRFEALELPKANVYLLHRFLAEPASAAAFEAIRQYQWRQDTLTYLGVQYPIPRLQQWFGDPGTEYTYSGLRLTPLPWTPLLLELKEKVSAAAHVTFNSVLVNQYRDGHDSIAWHSDSEPEFGPNPIIASLSLGATRDFVLRSNSDKSFKVTVPLENGSLLVMAGTTQEAYQHSVPKRKDAGPRINLTFRRVLVDCRP
jgi:alkylated DNA repair dioxygenase AlkB